jgi:hypothetical protein
MKKFAEFGEYQRKNSAFSWISCVVAPIHEDILLPGMTMKITIKD